MAMVEVRSRVLGPGQGDGMRNVFFDSGSERLTVRTIILRAVEEQVRDLSARKELTHQQALRMFGRQYQTEDEIRALREEEGRASVPNISPPNPIDLTHAQRHALDAFAAGRCLVFVGERQMESLDQEVELKVSTSVQFLRVLPLQGGGAD
jgi:hypothetical protein